MNSPANQFLELFPCIDSLWLGEGFNYNESPDYWLVEVSGIPYGLFGEMLQGGGNPWRGMVYGMTNRLGWSGDPRPFWKLWDSFGIQDARMIGYWDASCPVKTGRDDVLATAYVRHGKTLVAIGSWAPHEVDFKLAIDFKALGLDPAKTTLYAPPIAGVQTRATFKPSDALKVDPGRGWLLILEERSPKPPAAFVPFPDRKLLAHDRFQGKTLAKDWTKRQSKQLRTELRRAAAG